jgi:hypothetical protein
MKLGDAVGIPAQFIARQIDRSFGTDIEHCQGCAQRRETLNRFSDSMYDFFWKPKEKGIKMQYVITKQIAVEAETPEEAMSKLSEGRTISINVSERPQQQMPGMPRPVQAQPAPPR